MVLFFGFDSLMLFLGKHSLGLLLFYLDFFICLTRALLVLTITIHLITLLMVIYCCCFINIFSTCKRYEVFVEFY